MNRTLYWTLLLLALLKLLTPCSAACSGQQQLLRVALAEDVDEDDEETAQPQIDLSKLSEQQLQQLMQQLNVAQAADDYVEDHRGSSRPWNRVQRIIRRQLVRIPKRYLKKLLRQFGLARSYSGGNTLTRRIGSQRDVQPQLYYLIPLE